MSSPSEVEGLVLRVDAKVCQLEIDGEHHVLPLRGKLFEQPSHEKRPIAAGDRVRVRLEEVGGAIEEVLPRRSKLSRRASGGDDREQVLAANISLALVVTSIVEPRFQADLVDPILALAAREEIEAAVVITKIDRDRKNAAAAWRQLYSGLGYKVLCTSVEPGAETKPELDELGEMLHHNVTVFAGLSGVGKSTLINRAIPGLNLRIGSLSRIRQGKHTTTSTELHPLPGGGYVLDTPGIRSFGLFGVAGQEIAFLFREMVPLLPQCEYRNCLHLQEPGCAVLAALGGGEIAESRYLSYAAIVEDALAEDRADREGG